MDFDYIVKLADEIDSFVKKLINAPEESDKKQTVPSNDNYNGKIYQLPLRTGKTGVNGEAVWQISGYVDKSVNISARHPTGHEGIDWGAKRGSPIYPIFSGIVIEKQVYPKGGNTCKIQHDPDTNVVSYYAHMGEVFVNVGQKVGLNTILGEVSDTGSAKGTHPHLHLEVKIDGQKVNPLNVIGKPAGSFKK